MSTVEEWVVCGNQLQQFGSGLEQDSEPTREFEPIANISYGDYRIVSMNVNWGSMIFGIPSWVI